MLSEHSREVNWGRDEKSRSHPQTFSWVYKGQMDSSKEEVRCEKGFSSTVEKLGGTSSEKKGTMLTAED